MRTESYSSMNTFQQCARKYHYRYREGLQDEPGPQLVYGKRVHKNIEKRLPAGKEEKFAFEVMGRKVPTRYQLVAPPRLIVVHGQTAFIELQEHKFALSPAWLPIDFNDPEAFFRGVMDYVKIEINRERLRQSLISGGDLLLEDLISKVSIVDWKTRKSKSDRRQLSWYSLYWLSLYENLPEVSCQVVYLSEEKKSPEWIVKRGKILKIQGEIETVLERIRSEQLWRPRPSPLCNWCSFKKTCLQETSWENGTLNELVERGPLAW